MAAGIFGSVKGRSPAFHRKTRASAQELQPTHSICYNSLNPSLLLSHEVSMLWETCAEPERRPARSTVKTLDLLCRGKTKTKQKEAVLLVQRLNDSAAKRKTCSVNQYEHTASTATTVPDSHVDEPGHDFGPQWNRGRGVILWLRVLSNLQGCWLIKKNNNKKTPVKQICIYQGE